MTQIDARHLISAPHVGHSLAIMMRGGHIKTFVKLGSMRGRCGIVRSP